MEELTQMTQEANDQESSTPSEVQRWADAAMFSAEPHDNYIEGHGVLPSVYLIAMSPDPLGVMAAMSEMYKGKVVRGLSDVTDDQRRSSLEDMQRTHLPAPLEAVKLHFIIDGVDRAFTHQIVRQRTAAYAQESMRFAVIDDLPHNTTLPESLKGNDLRTRELRERWYETQGQIAEGYRHLVQNGVPQEDARGLLPHAVATRLNYVTDLRNLINHAGNRLCTQAQFPWRKVFNLIAEAIRLYKFDDHVLEEDMWQFDALVDSNFFRPVCYQIGHCPFQASFDRPCSIRDRVQAFSANGIPSDRWDTAVPVQITSEQLGATTVQPINPAEWLLDPTAAREA